MKIKIIIVSLFNEQDIQTLFEFDYDPQIEYIGLNFSNDDLVLLVPNGDANEGFNVHYDIESEYMPIHHIDFQNGIIRVTNECNVEILKLKDIPS